ncbi:transcription termination factor NusA [Thermodesulfatator autotrophicus]|uniref:Transcription termination/antitermination protein NusA n=1 Tax=Thermodesulfatator autotrophicus TaxID=1795632 RepID=A0A177E6C9_9BACT|nr:transcription termination factor NusA [Thermodesulfatator autotrophicus]OAG27507.1 transcription termination/antitermination protein NusA [Thermodesulfatator autotrophicus]
MAGEIRKLIDLFSKEKGIPREVIIEALEEGMKAAARKKFGSQAIIDAQYNEETGEIEVYRFREVVEKVENPETQISLEEARKLDPNVQVGDEVGTVVDIRDMGRIAAQLAKQILTQKVRGAERELIYQEFKDKVGQIVSGFVHRFDRGNIIVQLGRAEAILPVTEQIPNEKYKRGDRIRALIIEVNKSGREPQIVLSRTHPDFLKKLFELEVPEIQEGIVKIISVAREPGSRAKMTVTSTDPDVDPVGACVGLKGSRVQAVVQELKGEKIDIVPWSPDPARLVYNALAPAECTRVIVDEDNKTLEVIVPDDQLSLAIGKQGQNVRLASKLLGWRIDVMSETQYMRRQDPKFQEMLELEGMTEEIAAKLYDKGIKSVEDLAKASVEEVGDIAKIKDTEAQALIQAAQKYIEEKGDTAQTEVAETEKEVELSKES